LQNQAMNSHEFQTQIYLVLIKPCIILCLKLTSLGLKWKLLWPCIYLVSTLWWGRRDRKPDPTGKQLNASLKRAYWTRRKKHTILYLTHIYTTESWINIKDRWSVS